MIFYTAYTAITRDNQEVPIRVKYTIEKAYSGKRGDFGVKIEKDEDVWVEIEFVINTETKEEIDLSCEEERKIRERIMNEEDIRERIMNEEDNE